MMNESTRPSMRSAQRFLIFGALAGLILGCIIASLVSPYLMPTRYVYKGGAYPDELSPSYQGEYLATIIDSYVVDPRPDVAQERLKRFNSETKIRAMAERSVYYEVAGRAVEAQAVRKLAGELKTKETWNEETVKAVVSQLTTSYQGQGKNQEAQALTTFSGQVIGQVPTLPAAPQAGQTPPPAAATVAPVASSPPLTSNTWVRVLACLVLLIVVVAIVLYFGRLQRQKSTARKAVVWHGEGPAPLKQWSGTYNHGQDNYDEFFTIETTDGDFLGESGIGILEFMPGTSPKQVIAFDVGLFDKTDITTLSRVVMTEYAYNNEAIRAKINANPQAEAILAEPGKEFTLETTAMRVAVKLEDMEYGEGGKVYYKRLKVSLSVFLKEGADIRKGEMDIPEWVSSGQKG